MRVLVRTFAILREISADRIDVELSDGSRVTDAWRWLAARHPALEPHADFVRPARNGAYAAWDAELADGDEVAFLPPVSGGATTGIVDAAIDIEALESGVADALHGAVVTFAGRARRRADDGREVVELEYEVYPDMAERVLAEIVTEAEARWPGCVAACMHRTGVVPIGEAAIAIVTAAPHRAEAYEANRFVIEEVKRRLPIWKRERFTDGSQWKRLGA